MIARQQQRHFGFPHSKYLKVFRQILAAASGKKGNQWQKFGRKFLLKPAKSSSSSEIGLSFGLGAKIADEKSVCFRLRKRRY
jgi:hypothetical protein